MLLPQGLAAFGILITLVNGIFQQEALFAPLALGMLLALAGLALGNSIRAEAAAPSPIRGGGAARLSPDRR